jgi:hypothetical protein
MPTSTAIFTSLYNSLTEARAVARLGEVDLRCVCSSIEQVRRSSDFGLDETAPVEVTFLASEEPEDAPFSIGKQITVRRVGEETTDGTAFRIRGRRVTGGVVKLMLGGVNE